ncbi:MAG: PepSY domain-containing protein [Pseudomonadales bacterium]
MNKLTLRKIHRWLGLIAGIQLLAWTVSGLYFTIIPIEEIRGNHLLTKQPEPVSVADVSLLSVSDLAKQHATLADASLADVQLVSVLGQPVYLADNARFDAQSGAKLEPVSEAEAKAVVAERSEAPIREVEYVEQVPVDSEYRGGELPAWRVTIAGDENAALYVGTQTGRIRAVRTDAWRWFDLLWSLHIMDYEAREDFNHLLIQAMAGLGLVTVMSGLALFFLTLRIRR